MPFSKKRDNLCRKVIAGKYGEMEEDPCSKEIRKVYGSGP